MTTNTKKTDLLNKYVKRTNREINVLAKKQIEKLDSSIDTTIIDIDDDVKPLLLVLSSDLYSGNHDTALNNAATIKIFLLLRKAAESGLLDTQDDIKIKNPQESFKFLSNILSQGAVLTSSYLECMGKNMIRGDEPDVFECGLAVHMGINVANPRLSAIGYDIGALIGKIITLEDIDGSEETLSELLKQTPKNKYKKRLNDLIAKLTKEARDEIEEKEYEAQNETDFDDEDENEDDDEPIDEVNEIIEALDTSTEKEMHINDTD